MDHKQEHHQHHEKQREAEKKEKKEHEREMQAKTQYIHPLWFAVLGAVLVILAVVSWIFFF
jgi:cell division septal protein FtsQ